MAVTALLVHVGRNRLRYHLIQDGAAGTTATITSTGAATPDLLTDSVEGPIKKLAKAFTDGFAGFAAGALSQAQARALWLSAWVVTPGGHGGTTPAPGDPAGINSLIKTARCRVIPTSSGQYFTVDANVDGSGHPTLEITTPAGTPGTCFLDVEVPNAIGA
jgi:hypothetical protein